ncbi:unnamed protein product [Gongylonema pulchrum]|uniref:Uncharacterized protein n=1 Tax=Gongylonema pulchrum TaxID=637853 RepID=A0A183E9E1_9BILA|nr:unnamed protein product [Gongylonema pulchrum]
MVHLIQIRWYEALALFIIYISYCVFMKYNEAIEDCVKYYLGGKPNEVDVAKDVSALKKISAIRYDVDGVTALQPTRRDSTTREDQEYAPITGRVDSVAISRRRASSLRRQSIPILHSGAIFRNGIIQLMTQGLDPLDEGASEGMSIRNTPFLFTLTFSCAFRK